MCRERGRRRCRQNEVGMCFREVTMRKEKEIRVNRKHSFYDILESTVFTALIHSSRLTGTPLYDRFRLTYTITFLLLPLVISCGDPGTIANGIYIGREFNFNHTVIYRCNPGHLMEPPGHGRNVLRCIKDGTWNQTKPSCKGMRK